ncbi:TetR/AcrR family transcriptional regulator [Agreia sp. COWG]|uniref:TetR/AcrR family transcriptional regulator n=1 Tax=Agreia sp. COWG TaxID=2773266 RepID=UPI00192603F7|nr:TetR/AcrR family transcriptional regulator [Agreia sp. COWG]CAD6004782.1 TetR/AcrR family transcriptional regulator [Agreia sp. COWG]
MRSTAVERRSDASRVALSHFARGGYDGTAVSAIAAELGVSQPYLFKLFASKSALFVACVHLCYDMIEQNAVDSLDAAAADGRTPTLDDIGAAYRQSIADSDLLMFQLQAWAASGAHPEIKAVVAERFVHSLELGRKLTGSSADQMNDVFARGTRLVVTSVLGIELLA